MHARARKSWTRTGQSTAEYAVLIAVVLAALVGMQTFVKRGLQARYKTGTDTLTQVSGSGDFANFTGVASQYEPYYAVSDLSTARNDNFTETYTNGQVGRTGILSKATRTGSQGEGVDLNADSAWGP